MRIKTKESKYKIQVKEREKKSSGRADCFRPYFDQAHSAQPLADRRPGPYLAPAHQKDKRKQNEEARFVFLMGRGLSLFL